jgi:hypothetical protein
MLGQNPLGHHDERHWHKAARAHEAARLNTSSPAAGSFCPRGSPADDSVANLQVHARAACDVPHTTGICVHIGAATHRL